MLKREELRKKMKTGDWETVGNLLGITAHNACVSFSRPGSKRYAAVVAAVDKVIANRETLLTNQNNISYEKKNKKCLGDCCKMQ